MKTVSTILAAHSKTIELLSARAKDVNKQSAKLANQRKNIDKGIDECKKEEAKANAAIKYLSGLFNAVNNA
ncbi:MAG: hypothetical protein KAJ39_01275 [Gammaproteobacteria bacterium]|nr:hypothetical protein [Gammaproteobacteria bacterium]